METKPTISNREVEIGRKYFVKQQDSFSRPATILEMRFNKAAGNFEYYVHYDSTDHRLDEWIAKEHVRNAPASQPSTSDSHELKLTRTQKRQFDESSQTELTNGSVNAKRPKPLVVKRVERVVYGEYDIDTWYHSPFPKEYEDSKMLYVCDYCMKYMKQEYFYFKHRNECKQLHPPGRQIYRDHSFALYEVQGDNPKAKRFCQCLCYLAKLFIDQKTIFCDLDGFVFYVLCEVKGRRSIMVGFFSKEKGNVDDYNLACICILPPFQRTGYGKLLIQLSYELSKREGIVGSPEKPLSDLGKYSYQSYWSWTILEALKTNSRIGLEELSKTTGIHPDDIVDTLNQLDLVKLWKGKPVLRISKAAVDKCFREKLVKKPRLVLKPELLQWEPIGQK